MIGVIILCFDGVAAEMLRETIDLVGEVDHLRAVDIPHMPNVESETERVRKVISELDSGDGVVILTELFASSTANIANSLQSDRVEVVWGVNFPMLIRAASKQEAVKPLSEFAISITDAGRKYIGRTSDLLEGPVSADLTDEERLSAAAQFQACASDLVNLGRMLNLLPPRTGQHGEIGHNHVHLAPDASETFEEAMLAADAAASEVRNLQPRRSVLQLCIAALKRAMRLLKKIANWTFGKLDVFAQNAAVSAGKVAGPFAAAALLASQLNDQISELIAVLQRLIGQ